MTFNKMSLNESKQITASALSKWRKCMEAYWMEILSEKHDLLKIEKKTEYGFLMSKQEWCIYKKQCTKNEVFR